MRQITWADVAPGDEIQVSSGLKWTVTEHRVDGTVTMTRDGTSNTGLPNLKGTVTLLNRPEVEGMTEAAVDVVVSVLADKAGPGKPWRVPKTIVSLGDFRAHLFMLHGTLGTDLKTRKAIEDVHRQSHEDQLAGMPLPTYQLHEHTDEPWRG